MHKLKISKQDVIDIIKKRWWVMLIEFLVLGLILVADLVSKEYICDFLKVDGWWETHTLIPNFLDLNYSENTGAGFGIFKDNTTALIVVTTIVMVGVLVYLIMAQKQNEWLRISLIFVLGGGIGNLVDRIALGYVRDFFEFTFMDFAIFNVADIFVTVGAFMLVVVLIVMLVQEGKANKKKFEEEQAALANGGAMQDATTESEDSQDVSEGVDKAEFVVEEMQSSDKEANSAEETEN